MVKGYFMIYAYICIYAVYGNGLFKNKAKKNAKCFLHTVYNRKHWRKRNRLEKLSLKIIMYRDIYLNIYN